VPVQEGFAEPFQARQGHHLRAQGEGDRHGDCVSLAHPGQSQGIPRQVGAPVHVRRPSKNPYSFLNRQGQIFVWVVVSLSAYKNSFVALCAIV